MNVRVLLPPSFLKNLSSPPPLPLFLSSLPLQKELQNIEDASDELMMSDSTDFIPYPLI